MNGYEKNTYIYFHCTFLFLPLPQKKYKIYSSWIYNQYTVGSGIITVGPTRGQIFFSGAVGSLFVSYEMIKNLEWNFPDFRRTEIAPLPTSIPRSWFTKRRDETEYSE